MITSMTGYGKAVIEENDILAETEIRSLNSRFLDISIKVPRLLSDRELELRNIVKKYVNRGKISISLFLQKNGVDNRVANIQDENVRGVVNILNELQEKAGIKSELTIDNLLVFQNIIFSDDSGSNETEFEIAKRCIESALKELDKMRKAEGKSLVADLNNRIKKINGYIAKIEGTNREEIKGYFNKLKARAKELLEDIDQYDDRLKMELALLAEKYDVTEECIRLKSHINQFNETLKSENEVGRRLNFLIQEMNREANTINSKSISGEVTKNGISIKEELEKIREQIQNIE